MPEKIAVADPSGAFPSDYLEGNNDELVSSSQNVTAGKIVQESLASSLEEIIPSLHAILRESDKVMTALTSIVSTLISTTAKSKTFPSSFTPHLTSLLQAVMSEPQSQKCWKVVVGDLILDQRFLNMPLSQAEKWKVLVAKWAQADKERLQDYTTRLLTNGSNSNVLFGWSDQESTNGRRNLNRLAYIFLCGNSDGYLLNMRSIISKLDEILASETSSTESVRAEVYTCLRSIVIQLDPSHLTSLWTFIYTELEKTFGGLLETEAQQKITGSQLKIIVSACKLLDTLLVLGLEDFKL